MLKPPVSLRRTGVPSRLSFSNDSVPSHQSFPNDSVSSLPSQLPSIDGTVPSHLSSHDTKKPNQKTYLGQEHALYTATQILLFEHVPRKQPSSTTRFTIHCCLLSHFVEIFSCQLPVNEDVRIIDCIILRKLIDLQIVTVILTSSSKHNRNGTLYRTHCTSSISMHDRHYDQQIPLSQANTEILSYALLQVTNRARINQYILTAAAHSHRTRTMTSHHQTDQVGVDIQFARSAGGYATAVMTIRLSNASFFIGVLSCVRHTRQITMDVQHYSLYAYYATEDTTTEFSIATSCNDRNTFCIVHDGISIFILELIITKIIIRQYFVLVLSLLHCWNVSGSNRNEMLSDSTHSIKNLDAKSENIFLHRTHSKFVSRLCKC